MRKHGPILAAAAAGGLAVALVFGLLWYVSSGGDDEPAPRSSSRTAIEPMAESQARVVPRLILNDSVPLHYMWNGGRSGGCISANPVAEMFGDEPSPPTSYTLRNAEGTIVAAGELDETGGTWSGVEGGCVWLLILDEVDESAFYTLEVKNRGQSTEAVINLDDIRSGAKIGL